MSRLTASLLAFALVVFPVPGTALAEPPVDNPEERQVASLLEQKKFDEAKRVLDEWETRAPDKKEQIQGIRRAVEAVRRLEEASSELDRATQEISRRLKAMPAWSPEDQLAEQILRNDMERARELLAQGADPSKESLAGPLLVVAAQAENPDFVSLLLEKGAKTEAADWTGKTALIHAAEKGRLETARRLIAAGADVNARWKTNETALDMARKNGHAELAALLEERGGKATEKVAPWPMFRQPYASGDVNKDLLEAVSADDVEMVRKFIAQGADLNTEYLGGTPLIFAAQNGRTEIVRILLDAGADVRKRTTLSSPIQAAVANGHLETVQLLLDRGADVNETFMAGRSLLMNAAENGRREMVELLIQRGANVHAESQLGETARSLAEKKGYKEIAALLAGKK
ncbi:MAG: ankyrin repeat domain-containing protein [Candidatus Omnitrophica bacterium]|nr:ankyrin repeat domain-containing protein [Candidatus Omnitrophota bacterium]